MIAEIKDWLPMTVRNRVALGFAFVALVMFVTWNLMPYYPTLDGHSDGLVMTSIWPQFVDLELYKHLIRSRDINDFMVMAAIMALFLNAIVAFAVIPFWKFIHASNYLTAPLATVNLVGGFLILWFLIKSGVDSYPPYSVASSIFMALCMLALGTAMVIFKNELGIRHHLEFKKTMCGGRDSD